MMQMRPQVPTARVFPGYNPIYKMPCFYLLSENAARGQTLHKAEIEFLSHRYRQQIGW